MYGGRAGSRWAIGGARSLRLFHHLARQRGRRYVRGKCSKELLVDRAGFLLGNVAAVELDLKLVVGSCQAEVASDGDGVASWERVGVGPDGSIELLDTRASLSDVVVLSKALKGAVRLGVVAGFEGEGPL